MNSTDRRIEQSPIYQGEDEVVAYTLDVSPWGTGPTNISVVVKYSAGNDVSGTVLQGIPSAIAEVITTPAVKSLTAGEIYRIEVKFDVNGNTEEAWADLFGQE
jgi:hypothetical protein